MIGLIGAYIECNTIYIYSYLLKIGLRLTI